MARITIHLGTRKRLEARISKATPLGALPTEALVYLGHTCLSGPARLCAPWPTPWSRRRSWPTTTTPTRMPSTSVSGPTATSPTTSR